MTKQDKSGGVPFDTAQDKPFDKAQGEQQSKSVKKPAKADAKLTELQAKADEYLAGWQRSRAELDNFRKATLKQQAELRERQLQEVLQPLLGLADAFSAVTSHVPEDLKENPWAVGVLQTAKQLEATLTEYGVTPITESGTAFDPTQHEAVATQDDAKLESGMVISVVQPGYRLGERVLRPAKVTVST